MKKITFILFFILSIQSMAQQPKSLQVEKAKECIYNANYDSAYFYLRNVITTNDSLFNSEYDGKINALYDEYQIDEQILINKKAENESLLLLLLIVVAVVVIVFVSFLIIRSKTNQLKKEEQKLKDATVLIENSIKNKSIFLSNMSHEIRTPLNALVGFSRLLAKENTTKEEAEQYNDIIKLNSDLLLKLINDVVDVSTLDVNKMYFNIESTELIGLCYKTIETMSKLNNSSSQIVFDNKLESLYIMTDPTRLQQILINLISNSIKFCKYGIITLSLELKDNEVFFSVSDTGSGIPENKRESLFKRFSKLNEEKLGTGLGLSICKLIIKRLGGDIWLDTSYTLGARFIFNHPIRQKGGAI